MKLFVRMINAIANIYGFIAMGYFIAKGNHPALYAATIIVFLTIAVGIYQNVVEGGKK